MNSRERLKLIKLIQGNVMERSRERKPDAPRIAESIRDLAVVCAEAMMERATRKQARQAVLSVSEACGQLIRSDRLSTQGLVDVDEAHHSMLLSAAPMHFDSYIRVLEWSRPPDKSFYLPRRRLLKPVVDAIQALDDRDIRLLCVSLPPGVGKTTLAMFYLTYIAGKFPHEPSLTGSHSNAFVRGLYDECLRVFRPTGEYRWHDVFEGVGVSSTNAKDLRIDLGARKRFDTLEFTSIGSGNAGLYRASQLLYCDDLVSGIEVALNKERLDKLWEMYTTDLRQRKIGDHCAELHIATRWSVHDVIGRLEREYAEDPEAKFIAIPALNDKDESNFDYDYGVGFNTKFYIEQRQIMDPASWGALYKNEPVEREGQLYPPKELRRFLSLPDKDPDAIIAICDTKTTGTDYCFLPILYNFGGGDWYLEDLVLNNGDIKIIQSQIVDKLARHKVHMCRFESNSAGSVIAFNIQKALKERGARTSITTKYTQGNKETKIIVNSAWVKEHVLFKDESLYKQDRIYYAAMQFLTGYTLIGKNKNDDVPDGMAMVAEFIQSSITPSLEVIQRPF